MTLLEAIKLSQEIEAKAKSKYESGGSILVWVNHKLENCAKFRESARVLMEAMVKYRDDSATIYTPCALEAIAKVEKIWEGE